MDPKIDFAQGAGLLFLKFWQLAASRPAGIYVRTPQQELTYEMVLRYAIYLKEAYNIKSSDTVLLCFDNPLLLCLYCWASLYANANIVLQPGLSGFLPSGAPRTTKCITDHPGIQCLSGTECYFVDSLPALEERDVLFHRPLSSSAGRQIFFFSSGTTGLPSMIPVSHDQLLWSITCIMNNGWMPYTKDRTVFIGTPLCHSLGFSVLMEYTFGGSTIVLPSTGSTITSCIRLLASDELGSSITNIETVPYGHEQILVMLPKLKHLHLQHVGFGGDRVDTWLLERYRSCFPQISFSTRYGLTELPSVISLCLSEVGQEPRCNGGTILPIYTVTVNSIPEGMDIQEARGEIEVRYNSTYLEQMGFTENIPEASIRTGDIGYIQNDRLFIVGRTKQIVKVRGFTVDMVALEKIVVKHPGISDACALFKNEKIIIMLVAEDINNPPGRDVIIKCILANLPRYYLPHDIVYTSSIKRSNIGKKIRYFPQA